MKSFTAGQNDTGVRLNRFCEKVCSNIPSSLLQKSFRNKRIKVNGKRQTPDYRINLGDIIELYINDEFFSPNKEKLNNLKTNNKLNIIYEDENLLFIFKPSGLLCHSDNKNQDNIVDMVRAYLFEKGEYQPCKENTFTPSLCNRIDQGTEGIVIAAKNYRTLSEMNKLIFSDKLIKKYLCLTENPVKDGEYFAFLTRNLQDKKVKITTYPAVESKPIVTRFTTINSKNNLFLIECTLITGRTHQIRAHLAFLGSSILGDKKYGKPVAGIDSQMLSAYEISFNDIDKESSLFYLNNKKFSIKDCSVLRYFNRK